jgi:Icc-related predicted phosphoesterase
VILFVGDIHHRIQDLEDIIADHPEADVVVQVGDLVPLHSETASLATRWRPMRLPVHFIDGNHHYFGTTDGAETATEICPGLIYQPRGSVSRLDGRTLAFLGGAETPPGQEWRAGRDDYWPDRESVKPEDIELLMANATGSVDFLITHTPPASVLVECGKSPGISARLVEEAWDALGRPQLICGHLHSHFAGASVEVLPFLGATLL